MFPEVCSDCGARLRGRDSHPHRHQQIELPPIVPRVSEYQLHQLTCDRCGCATRASLPVGVSSLGYGERLTAVVALLSGSYRQSHRQVQGLMRDLFNLTVSRGGVSRLRQQMSAAVSETVAQAKTYVHSQAVLHSDETGFEQTNRDGLNPEERQGWLWVLFTPMVSFFEVVLSRSQATSKALIGEAFAGIVNSHRYSAYNWIALNQRQLCWAHLKRDLTAIAERSGVSQEIGEALLRRERRLFGWWHQCRAGTLSRSSLMACVEHLRAGFKAELEAAAALPIANGETTPLAKTVRTCCKLLTLEPALWTFVYTAGIEPTNNAAERALRPRRSPRLALARSH
ncbi:IS66 family transposase [Synechococcus sp. PCC 7336]|uniref:IS66 family transposase n=1 Tax=Synechococcus sp. PCC 7336 TaxID=195250 RepID=UPI0021010AD3|nr:IS66 family transposase [Synechococcus sp. PCC 7336]